MTQHAPLVMVATDLSDASTPAITQAHERAHRAGAPLAVIHVLPDMLPLQHLFRRAGHDSREAWDSQEKITGRHVTEQVQRLTGRAAGDFDVYVRRGSPHASILALAEELRAALVVVAASAKAQLERVLLGSTAEAVMRHASIPVLVARESPPEGMVLVATDLSDMAVRAMDAAVVEASRLHAPLSALYCLDVDRPLTATFNPFVAVDDATRAAIHEAAHESLKVALAGFDMEGQSIVMDGDPKQLIAKAARDHKAQLVVVGTHGTTGPVRFLLGSVALAAARTAPCSVLVARHESGDSR